MAELRNMKREQKIAVGEMRSANGPTRLLVYCSDRKCSHSVVVDAMTFFVEIGIRPRPVGESTLPGQNY